MPTQSPSALPILRESAGKLLSGRLVTLPIGSIQQPSDRRYRKLDLENLDAIMRSLPDQGQTTPIEVEPYGDNGSVALVTGRHRLEAFVRLDKANAPEGDHRFANIVAFQFDKPLDEETRTKLMRTENVTRRNIDADTLYKQFKDWRKKHPPLPGGRPKRDVPPPDPSMRSNEQAAIEFGVSIKQISRWQADIKAEEDQDAAAKQAAKKKTKAEEREVAKKAAKQAVQQHRVARSKPKTSTYTPPAPTPTVQVSEIEDTGDMLADLNSGLVQAPGVQVEAEVGRWVRGFSMLALEPDFVQLAAQALAELPSVKLKLLRDVLVKTHELTSGVTEVPEEPAQPEAGAAEGEQEEQQEDSILAAE